MTFLEMVKHDNVSVFSDTAFFAENRQISIIGGDDLGIVPVILDGEIAKDREYRRDDHGFGVHMVSVTMFAALEKLGTIPEKGADILIDQERYTVDESSCEMGMVKLALRRYDE